MNNTIIYRPYKSQIWFALFSAAIGVLSFVTLGICISTKEHIFFWAIVGILSVCLTKVLFDGAKVVILFKQEGVHIVGNKDGDIKYFPWKELPHRYYARSYKGHLFLILSPKALSAKELENLANRGANTSKVCMDSVVVIYVDVWQKVSQLKEFVDKKYKTGD